jgi:hypothetical protein
MSDVSLIANNVQYHWRSGVGNRVNDYSVDGVELSRLTRKEQTDYEIT